ncbi:Transcription factor IIIB subunit [Sesamum alatum]|uniref:Transcription factor IIIB subunit n=1 Tax=Sesamum alatum TaxID=300844 RepID=A0AAE2CRN4_9LAMI|nr:Transcription factor IIIB subunit [Sesamum alatum]
MVHVVGSSGCYLGSDGPACVCACRVGVRAEAREHQSIVLDAFTPSRQNPKISIICSVLLAGVSISNRQSRCKILITLLRSCCNYIASTVELLGLFNLQVFCNPFGLASMVWCGNCAKNISRPDYVDGKICCSLCGRVLDEDNFSQEPTFVKNAAGQSQLSGNFVKTIQNEYSASRERILNEAYNGIDSMIYALGIDGGDSIARPALAFYTIAVERNFTRGRRKELVEAACLYISCRENKKPYLLIDFSEYLNINVYVLGAVFLQLCKLLSLEEHPIVQKPVDPSLFIHRFTDRLFGGRKPTVSRTALHIVASMKRDWMQTGRKPSGLCGAALYISALSHGLKCSKSEIIKVVHICEATLTKRLIEFENTESGGLTIEEFNTKAEELEKEERLTKSLNTGKASGIGELLCEHKGGGRAPFAHGLCESCYEDFIKLSGGLEGGSEPPAFQRAERERIMAEEAAAQSKLLNSNGQRSIKNMGEREVLQPAESESTGATLKHNISHDSGNGRINADDAAIEESETLSDIDDIEVDVYLHSEEEKQLKKIIWEEMNKEYLEEQAAKEAAALAAKKAHEATFTNCSEDVQAAQKLAAAAAAAVAKSRKERQQKRAADVKNSGPAQTAAEATRQMLDRKRLSSKIRYDVLEKLFDDSENPETTKKSRTEADADGDGDDKDFKTSKQENAEVEGTQNTYSENIEEYDFHDDYNNFADF